MFKAMMGDAEFSESTPQYRLDPSESISSKSNACESISSKSNAISSKSNA
jgi:hypothetical protein